MMPIMERGRAASPDLATAGRGRDYPRSFTTVRMDYEYIDRPEQLRVRVGKAPPGDVCSVVAVATEIGIADAGLA